MLKELGHPFARGEPVYDVTFENVQAGLRTDYLFRLANQRGGIVLGTGDLSELALGWSTYGVGDQMSHYNVNAGVPKTLIQHLIRWVIGSEQFDEETGRTLAAILDTEISPELVPGEEMQTTESKIGPYALQDFNSSTCCATASGRRRSPSWPGTPGTTRRRRLAAGLPGGQRVAYDLAEIRRWLEVFCRASSRSPVQALGHAERAEGLGRRLPLAARRLARAVRRYGACLVAGSRALRRAGRRGVAATARTRADSGAHTIRFRVGWASTVPVRIPNMNSRTTNDFRPSS